MRAVVLSGGGGKGAYQIGVWKALRKLKYDYDIVTGTSIGAINGLMMVQKRFYAAYFLWRNVNSKKMIGENLEEAEYIEYVKKFVKTGGVSTIEVEKFVNKLYNKKKFRNSKINYGIVTYNFSKLKPCIKTKDELSDEEICKYIVASATCFPAFKMTDINGEKYIDGGYYDNLPINLAIDMGATEIIAVDLEAIGLKRKIKDDNINVTHIKPNNKIASFLEFNKAYSRRDINYGYNDTMKKFGVYDGKEYTFYNNKLSLEKYKEFMELNDLIFESGVRITNFKLSKYLKSLTNKEELENIFDETLEMLLKKYDYNDSKIYNANKVCKNIIKRIMKIDGIYNRLSEDYKIQYIYKLICDKNYNEIRKVTNSMYKEFVCAIYLYVMVR